MQGCLLADRNASCWLIGTDGQLIQDVFGDEILLTYVQLQVLQLLTYELFAERALSCRVEAYSDKVSVHTFCHAHFGDGLIPALVLA